MTNVLIPLAVYLGILALCLWRPNAGRIFIGIFFLLMAWAVNGVVLATNPGMNAAYGSNALIPFLRPLFTEIVGAHPAFWMILLIAYETATGLLILLGRGRQIKAGLILGIIFLLGITPLGVETQTNPVMAIALQHLLSKEFPRSLRRSLSSEAA